MIRLRLYDYIRVADYKKIKAIYTIVEDEINLSANLWEEEAFLKELDKRMESYESGKAKMYTLKETEQRAKLALKKGKTRNS